MNELIFSDHLLERCLEEVAQTGDIEAVLRQYPQHADELRPLLEIALAARAQYADVPNPPGNLADGRARMLQAAAQHREWVQSAPPPPQVRRGNRLLLALKLVGVLLVGVMGMVLAGGGVVRAANESLPRDVLYPVKLSLEDVQLALALTPRGQVELALQFAEERAAEIRSLAVLGLPVPEGTVARMEHHVQYALDRALSAPEGQAAVLLEQVAEQTNEEAETLGVAQDMAPSWARAGLERARTVYLQVHDAAVEALDGAGPSGLYTLLRWGVGDSG